MNVAIIENMPPFKLKDGHEIQTEKIVRFDLSDTEQFDAFVGSIYNMGVLREPLDSITIVKDCEK